MATHYTNYLEEAKEMYRRAKPPDPDRDKSAVLSVAAVLIALVERLDYLSDEYGALRVTSSEF